MDLSKFEVIPLHHIVILEPEGTEHVRESGLILRESDRDRQPRRGTVLSIGPGYTRDDGTVVTMAVKVGDTVLYRKGCGMEYERNGKTILLINQDEILGVVQQ